ncbi:MAG: 4-(cytidine 5'-diphospho)-2-C-methyl-D-erythritol kinase [Actinomycetota bacterium]|nr:4-(cytidine 5'-diphospho)-2-C-methyl-D-erythritol kinase [Actinomycetota bacterium]
MKSLKLKAYAKINLYLDILGRRADGYHDIQSIMQTLELSDTLLIFEHSRTEVICDSSFLSPDRNLIWQAAKLLQERYKIKRGALIKLIKNIPVAAGLGGGSADAAAILIGLNLLWDLNLSLDRLQKLGEDLGSDVPFCVRGGTVLVEGKGERLTPLPDLPRASVVIARPSFELPTPRVYSEFDQGDTAPLSRLFLILKAIHDKDMKEICSNLANILERPVFRHHPEVRRLKETAISAGALGALMTGSGPSVFAIVDSETMTKKVAGELGKICPRVITTAFYTQGVDILEQGKNRERLKHF